MTIGKDTVNVEATIPAKDNSIGPGRPATKPPEGYERLQENEKTFSVAQVARSLLNGDWGAMTPFTVTSPEGQIKQYMARVDAHYHKPPPPGASPEEQKKYPKPWGWHKGVTVYKKLLTTVEDYVPEQPENPRLKFLQRIDQFYQQFGVKPD